MDTKKMIVVGAAGAVLIATGALPAAAAEAHVSHGFTKHLVGQHRGTFEGQNGQVVMGSITGLASGSLVLTPKSHKNATSTPLTVSTTASTTVMKDGQTAALADLQVGEMAIISGTKTGTTTLEASRIFVRTKAKAFGWLRHK